MSAPESGGQRAFEPEGKPVPGLGGERTHQAKSPRRVRAFAPGRVNLIGEHTDYNRGLALPFAITQGVTVNAHTVEGSTIVAYALDLDERDEFPAAAPAKCGGWRGFARGVAAELHQLGVPVPGAELEIAGDVPRNAGLSSSAALTVSLALALLGLAGVELERNELARLCSRVENEWLGAHTGLLDQLASLYGERDRALRIDFATLAIEPVPLALNDSGDTRCARIPESASGWRLATLDSGEGRTLAASGYNERREECARACELLGVKSLREADAARLGDLPRLLASRVRHVLDEIARVERTVAALRRGELERVGELLDEAHASLRDLYECSTPAVEAAVARLKGAGAVGARIVGGGFGGHALGLFPPGAIPPTDALEVRPSAGARLHGG